MPFTTCQTEYTFLFIFAAIVAILQSLHLLSLTIEWMRGQTAQLHGKEPPPLQCRHCLAAVSLSSCCCHPRRRQNSSYDWSRDHNVTITANSPTHLHHGRARPRLMGGILMLGERGVIVAMPLFVCVFVYVERQQKIRLDLKKSGLRYPPRTSNLHGSFGGLCGRCQGGVWCGSWPSSWHLHPNNEEIDIAKCISIILDLRGTIVMLVTSAAVELSVWIGLLGWGQPMAMRVWRWGIISCAVMNSTASSDSAAKAMMNLMILAIERIAPLNRGNGSSSDRYI